MIQYFVQYINSRKEYDIWRTPKYQVFRELEPALAKAKELKDKHVERGDSLRKWRVMKEETNWEFWNI